MIDIREIERRLRISREPSPSKSAADIERFTSKVGGRVSSDYIDFIVAFGDSVVLDYPTCRPIDNSVYKDVCPEQFTQWDREGPRGLAYLLRVFGTRLPSGAIPIARDPGGNLFCIRGGDMNGAVWFWSHEHEDPEGNPEAAMFLVARSFEQFLMSIEVPPSLSVV